MPGCGRARSWRNLLLNEKSSLFELLGCFNELIECLGVDVGVLVLIVLVIIGIRYECPQIKGLR